MFHLTVFRRRSTVITVLILAFVVFSLRGDVASTNTMVMVPNLSATKSAATLTDVNGNGVINPGDSLRYTVTINNTGPDPATGVAISDTIDANTTLIGGQQLSADNDTGIIRVVECGNRNRVVVQYPSNEVWRASNKLKPVRNSKVICQSNS